METTIVNTAVARVTLQPVERDPYDPTQRILYHTSISLVERLVKKRFDSLRLQESH